MNSKTPFGVFAGGVFAQTLDKVVKVGASATSPVSIRISAVPAHPPRHKALDALGGNPHSGRAVVAKMKEMPTNDDLFGPGAIRADGRKIHPA